MRMDVHSGAKRWFLPQMRCSRASGVNRLYTSMEGAIRNPDLFLYQRLKIY